MGWCCKFKVILHFSINPTDNLIPHSKHHYRIYYIMMGPLMFIQTLKHVAVENNVDDELLNQCTVKLAELPFVNYCKMYSGFINPHWAFVRGFLFYHRTSEHEVLYVQN